MSRLCAYVLERMLRGKILALILMLLITSCLLWPPKSPAEVIARFGWVALLVAHFRLLDDLADIRRDRREHPRRVLSTSPSLKPFVISWILLSLAVAVIAVAGGHAAIWSVTVCGLLAWYRLRRGSSVLHHHIVLLKYPAIVWMSTPTPESSAGVVGTLVTIYLSLCVFEFLDDRKLRQSPQARPLFVVEFGILIVLLILLTSSNWRHIRQVSLGDRLLTSHSSRLRLIHDETLQRELMR